MAAANAQIGVAYAAYYPSLTLSGSGGVESSALKNLFGLASRFWSVGPSLSETIYDGGLRRATVNQYIATYNADLARIASRCWWPFSKWKTTWLRCAFFRSRSSASRRQSILLRST
jgi:hypothetical protein